MRPVLIVCPTTDRLVSTGFEANALDELDADFGTRVLVACPECNKAHEWEHSEAVLAAFPLAG